MRNTQIYVDNIIAVLVTKRVEYTILFWPLQKPYMNNNRIYCLNGTAKHSQHESYP